MTTPHNTHNTTCDGLGRFTSTDPEVRITAPTHSTTASGQLDTPFEASPDGFSPVDLEGETKEDSPYVANYTNPDHYEEAAPMFHPAPRTHTPPRTAAVPTIPTPPHSKLPHQMT